MTTFEPTCTEPGRWDRAPDAEASASEILAYLQHCDGCAFHTQLVDEEDRPLDLLLQEACGDLVVDDVALPGVTGTAVGLCDDTVCIKVYLTRSDETVMEQIPETFLGFRVDIEVTGEFRAREGGTSR